MWLTPKYKDTDFQHPLKLDDKITIFLDRTDGWQLFIAEQCSAIPHSAFAVLHIILSYFETIAKYHNGFAQHGQSAHYFKRGVELVFPPIMQIPDYVRDAILIDLYSGARCGLYHGSMTLAHIAVSGLEEGDFRYDPNTRTIVIDPGRMTKTLRQHLTAYGAQLRDHANVDLRARFESRFDFDASQPQGAAWQQP